MASHSLIRAFKNLKGNARGCVLTEPLWGIPFNLYVPYVSVYMRSLGLVDSQIGLVASVGLGFQMIASLVSGAITDKLGRKRATLIFDLLSWSVPCLIWAVAQDFTYFVVAAIINSLWRVPMTSWTCLLVEDTDPADLMDIYSWIYISGFLVVFFAPLASVLISAFTLVPTMRGLYLLAFVLMTAKFVVMNGMVTETRQGEKRMQETKAQPVLSMLNEYRGVLRQVLRTPATLITLGILLMNSIYYTVNNTFWAIFVTERLHIPAQHIALYPFARSVLLLIVFFTLMPRIRSLPFKIPMLAGYAGLFAAHLLLINVPEKNYGLLMLSVLLEACSFASLGPQIDRMLVLTVDAQERARIMAILFAAMLVLASPFGWIAGLLSGVNRTLPFIMNLGAFTIGAGLTLLATRVARPDLELVEAGEPVA